MLCKVTIKQSSNRVKPASIQKFGDDKRGSELTMLLLTKESRETLMEILDQQRIKNVVGWDLIVRMI